MPPLELQDARSAVYHPLQFLADQKKTTIDGRRTPTASQGVARQTCPLL